MLLFHRVPHLAPLFSYSIINDSYDERAMFLFVSIYISTIIFRKVALPV